MTSSCGNCASMRPARLNGVSGYCSLLLVHRRTDVPVLDCPHWGSDAEVRAELLGEAHHSPNICGACVCYNPGPIQNLGSCTPVGPRSAQARGCRRYFSTAELNAPLYGAKAK